MDIVPYMSCMFHDSAGFLGLYLQVETTTMFGSVDGYGADRLYPEHKVYVCAERVTVILYTSLR